MDDDDDLHTNNTFFNSSSSSNNHQQFGSFILLTSSTSLLPNTSKEYSLIRISSSSSSIDSVSRSSSDGSGSGGCLLSAPGCTGSDDNHNQDDNDDQLVFKVDNNSGGGGGGGGGLVFKLDNIGSPEYDKSFVFTKKIIGSCNGLVCLHDTSIQEVYLWNPATKQYKTLPKAPLHLVDENQSYRFTLDLVAFGFDVETKDYKVMLLTGFQPNNHRPAAPPTEFLCRVQVYSLSTDSWRVLEDIISLPGYPFFNFPAEVVCLNNGNSCFFLAQYFRNKHQLCFDENNRLVISFDFTKEIFTAIELPEHNRHQKLYLSCLGDDKLTLFIVSCKPSPRGDNYYPDMYEIPPPPPPTTANYPEIYEPPRGIYYSDICGCQDFNIWVLDEHVVSSNNGGSVNKESWRQLHSFQLEHQTPGQWCSPTCISNDGEFALLETINPWPMVSRLGKKMKLYNLVTKEVKKDFLSCNRVMSKAYAYKPSLVSIIGGNGGAAAADSTTNL